MLGYSIHKLATHFVPATIVGLLSFGCADTPMRHLQNSGRIIGEARTFEACGHVVTGHDSQNETTRIRFVFGPKGEYRAESGTNLVIHDTWYIAAIVTDESYVNVMNTREYNARCLSRLYMPYCRWPGDPVMAVGMSLRGKTDPFMPFMRILGPSWMQQVFPAANIQIDGHDQIGDHDCTKYDIDGPDGRWIIWLDSSSDIMWKCIRDSETFRLNVEYDTILVNPALNPDEFVIPQWVFEKAKEQK